MRVCRGRATAPGCTLRSAGGAATRPVPIGHDERWVCGAQRQLVYILTGVGARTGPVHSAVHSSSLGGTATASDRVQAPAIGDIHASVAVVHSSSAKERSGRADGSLCPIARSHRIAADRWDARGRRRRRADNIPRNISSGHSGGPAAGARLRRDDTRYRRPHTGTRSARRIVAPAADDTAGESGFVWRTPEYPGGPGS